MKKVYLTVDVEQDCPPYLDTMKGAEEGLPRLLDLFLQEGIKVTFFTTGKVAEAYPFLMNRLIRDGHELGCHGYTHKRFNKMSAEDAEFEIKTAAHVLRQYSDNVISFRAPNLRFPKAYLPMLAKYGFQLDSSAARYKIPKQKRILVKQGVTCVPVSITSSFLRLPRWLIYPRVARLDPLVLFVHPWEFIDMSKTDIRLDCRFRTGDKALQCLSEWITLLKRKGYQFKKMQEMLFLQDSTA